MKIIAVLALCLLFLAFARAEQDDQCDMCNFIVGSVEYYVEEETSIDSEILASVSDDCSISSNAAMCRDYVQKHGQAITALVRREQRADFICSEVDLCTASDPIYRPHSTPSSFGPDDVIECGICEFLVDEIELFTLENVTKGEMPSVLKHAQLFPVLIGKLCVITLLAHTEMTSMMILRIIMRGMHVS
eukprot:Phypoly_transcript_20688.p1 GENE.Phypoly_transcript_20688~~Phypoly_transcript_20688.p1  ORF type:complete len:189 (+),score=14.52 Phypoly_transcript_20688:68-634(+)